MGQVLHDAIRVDREGAVVTLTIDHPPANAVNGDVVNGLAEGLAAAEADETCRAVVITGNGPKFFSAGADIKGFGAGADAVGKGDAPHARDRGVAPPCDRRRQRDRVRWRMRADPGVRHPHRVEHGAFRSTGDQARDHPWLGRDPAAAEAHRERPGDRAAPDWRSDRCPARSGTRTGRRGRRAG